MTGTVYSRRDRGPVRLRRAELAFAREATVQASRLIAERASKGTATMQGPHARHEYRLGLLLVAASAIALSTAGFYSRAVGADVWTTCSGAAPSPGS